MKLVERQTQEPVETRRRLAWDCQTMAYQKLTRLTTEPAETVFGAERLQKAFAQSPEGVYCIDERAIPVDDKPRVGLAGSGVLLDTEQFTRTANRLNQSGLKYATFHEGCGACALYCHQYSQAHPGKKLDPALVAKQVAQSLGEHLDQGQPARLVGYSATATIPMRGEPDFHDARAIVLDGTGRFNPETLGLPPAFLCSVRYHPESDYTKQELGVAISIAIGEHGFGYGRFRQAPLAVLMVGDPYDEAHSVVAIQAVAQHILTVHQDVVKVLALTAPRYKG